MDNLTKKEGNTPVLNREFKDTVFRMLFSEKDKLIELYNAIYGTDYGSDTPVDINTIEEVFGNRFLASSWRPSVALFWGSFA